MFESAAVTGLWVMALLAAGPWSVETLPLRPDGGDAESVKVVDDAWVGFTVAHEGVFVAQPGSAPIKVLDQEADVLPGVGFSVLTKYPNGWKAWRIDGGPKPAAREAATFTEKPLAFSCAGEFCAWVDTEKIVVARAAERHELSWPVSESSRGLIVYDARSVAVSPDGTQVAIELPELVMVFAVDGSWVELRSAWQHERGATVATAEAAFFNSRVASHADDECGVFLAGWSAPHQLHLLVRSRHDGAVPGDCGPRDPRLVVVSSTWRRGRDDCALFHASGASLSVACVYGEYGPEPTMPFALPLGPDSLLIGDTYGSQGFSYRPPSPQQPDTPVRFEGRWRVVTFGGEAPVVQPLPAAHTLFKLEVSLPSGWHVFDRDDSGPRWVRFTKH